MFGRDGAVHLDDQLVHRAADLLPAREVGRAFGALRLRQVEMNVAVSDVAEGHRADARHHRLDQRRDARDELRHPGDGHRDVVDRKSTRLNSSHYCASRMPSSACKKKTTQTYAHCTT